MLRKTTAMTSTLGLKLVGLLVVGLLVVSTAPAHAEPAPASKHVTYQLKRRADLSAAPHSTRAAKATAGDKLATDPPLGGCDDDVYGDITAYYTDGVLTDVEYEYFSNVICVTTAPGQQMQYLQDTASAWLNNAKVDEDHEPGKCAWCNTTGSQGVHYCISGPACAGNYWNAHVYDMQLPPGWVWTGAPSGCTLVSSTWLQCASVTSIVTVTPRI